MELEPNAPAPAEAMPAPAELPQEHAAAPADGAVAQNPEQQAPEGEGNPPAEGSGKKPPKPEHRTHEYRYSDLTKQVRDRDMQLAEMRGKLSAFEQLGLQPSGQPQPQPAQVSDGRPDPNQYAGGEYDPHYTEDLARFAAREEFARLGQERQQREAHQTGEQRFQEAFAEADNAAAESDFYGRAPEVLEVIGQRDPRIADVLIGCESRLDVAEYLGRGDNLRQLAAMPPAQKVAWIGKIDAINSVVHTTCANAEYVAEYLRTGDNLRILAAMPLKERAAALRQVDDAIGKNLAAQAPTPAAAPLPAPNPSPAPVGTLTGRGATPDIQPKSFSDYEARAAALRTTPS